MYPKVLIVDDDPAGREALESILMTQNYTLAFAANGREALAKSKELLPDVILLDVMMPDLDGYEVCRRLRADPHLAEVPVVMVTALDDRASRLQGIEAGVDDFVTKPIDRAELRARVKTITRLNRYRNLQQERAKLELQLQHLNALRTIDIAITTHLDMRVTLDTVLQQVTNELKVDAAAVLLYDRSSNTLEQAAGTGFRTRGVEHRFLSLNKTFAGRAVLERSMVCHPNLKKEAGEFAHSNFLHAEDFRAYYAVPLIAKGDVQGVLEVFHRTPLFSNPDWLGFLEALAAQAAIAVDNARLFANLQRSKADLMQSYDATIEGWSHALDLRDRETEGHTLRVTDMTLRVASSAGMEEEEMVHVRRGALLHDIGKLGVPDSILFKSGSLTDQEWSIMRQHPVHAYELLSPVSYLRPALDIPYCHHEKWDGTGYPRGLEGEQIPLAARIFAVIDVWDALLSDRPYRQGWPTTKVRKYIEGESGRHFDPFAVETFLKVAG